MNAFQIIYAVLIKPLQIFFEYIFTVAQKGINNPGLSIVALSLSMNLLVLPLYNKADALQEEERETEKRLQKGVAHIKKTFRGDEKMMMLQTYYRQNNYKPTDVLRGILPLLLEIPFFIAAYQFLSHLEVIQNVPFGPIANLGAPDALLNIGSFSVNLLPIIMTTVNLLSCVIFTKGYPLKSKIQLYSMAVFFFFFLYKSPAGLVFYWTLNNIFSFVKTVYYKSEKAKNILNVLFAICGVGFFAAIIPASQRTGSKSFFFILALLGFICFLPILFDKVLKKEFFTRRLGQVSGKLSFLKKGAEDGWLFVLGGIYMSILTGLFIPTQVLKSSPQEFVDIYHFMNPLWFVIGSLCLAVGTFLVWFGVFYRLSEEGMKKIFNVGMCILCFIATVDYIIFGKNNVVLDSALAYTQEYSAPVKMILINFAVVILTIVIGVAIVLLLGKKLRVLFIAGTLAILGMSLVSCHGINKDIQGLKKMIEAKGDVKPSFRLSKTGKNVVVIMLDRGMNLYVPYLVNEKPELKEMYDGFCYYPNTISFGLCTNYGAPPIFGGYEYTPVEMNKRDTELLKEKHNESLKVMPALFYEKGYETTVCDAPYANYSAVPDLSIYKDYPDIRTFITQGYYWNAQKVNVSQRNFRNFFCYSLMKIAPLALQNHLYGHGTYNESIGNKQYTSEINSASPLVRDGNYRMTGINEETMNDYLTLANFQDMTEITQEDTDTFLMINNELTHWPIYYQEPEYVVEYSVDNEAYELAHSDRYTLDGLTLEMSNDVHYGEYQVNMCALLLLGKWLDYLKEEGVYDNTRIIIVSDHGLWTYHNEKFELDKSHDQEMDIESYYPLLMIKDFNSHGFSVDEQFMTNADVPYYTLEGLIENPVNPFTGKSINIDEKYAHPQEILGAHFPDVDENNGTVFIDGIWFAVENDMRDKKNWKILKDNRKK